MRNFRDEASHARNLALEMLRNVASSRNVEATGFNEQKEIRKKEFERELEIWEHYQPRVVVLG